MIHNSFHVSVRLAFNTQTDLALTANTRGAMQAYEPTALPPSGIEIAQLVTLVGEANAALARYTDCCKAW